MLSSPSIRSLAAALALLPAALAAQARPSAAPAANKDPMQEGLPLKPARTVAFTTRVGSWMSVDVSPDGRSLVFDLLGDIYTMPIGGGKATALTRGMGMDAQPRFSPDGRRVVFISDRDGGNNVWILSLDGKDTVQVTRGKTTQYYSPEFTPDGNYIVVTRNTKLHMYHVDGGAGQQMVRAPTQPGVADVIRTMGAAFGKDSRYIWYARRNGGWRYNTPLGDYQLAVYDRQTGQSSVRSGRNGSAFRPTLSADGTWLVYGSRHIDQTGLRIRNLETGDERWLTLGVQRDDQESLASLDVYPGMSFTPDSKALIATWNGKLWRVPVDSGAAPSEIPFEADVRLALGPEVHFEYRVEDAPTFVVKQIRDAVPSPDGRRLAFTAMDRLYVMDLLAAGNAKVAAATNGDGGATLQAPAPRRVTDAAYGEFQPSWSPDGQHIVYTTWANADGGHLYKARADGRGAPQRLTRARALYTQPVFTPDGRRIVALRGPARAYTEALAGGIPGGAEDLVWLPSSGGEVSLIAPAGGLGSPHFTKDTTRIFAYGQGQGLVSMRWDGTDQKTHLRVTAPPQPGAPPGQNAGAPAGLILMAPEGDQALAQVYSDLFVVTVPLIGGTEPTITVGTTDNAAFPTRRLTEIGGQFAAWSRDAKKVHWSIGNAHFVYDLDRAKAFDDSVRAAARARGDTARAGRDSSAARPDSARAEPVRPDTGRSGRPDNRVPSAPAAPARPQYQPVETRVRLLAERDTPKGTVVLRGGRAITMKGTEVIENADVVVRDNRIVGVGASGQVAVPADARIVDLSGKTIIPGFVDTHAHLRAAFGVHRDQVWSYAANLAYGVTTARDPQTGTTDVLSYEDQVTAGKILGPRIYSTGPGVFGFEQVRDLDHARRILKRYSEYYDTKTIKQYGVGNREQRQWIIEAARELRLMPTTEGALDIRMNITEAFDGYSGHEHTWPTFPMQSDVMRMFAESKIVYTPTILVAYGGPWAENYYYATEDVLGDAKLRHFTPWADLEGKALRRGGSLGTSFSGTDAGWFHPTQHVFTKIGEQVKDFVAAGGRAGVGSHGQLQGLGYHWELWSVASGGLSNHDALRAATLHGAEGLGLARDLGSLEIGKLADMVILDRNPLENIRNSNSVRMVMKNGRLHDGDTLDELWPRAQKVGRFYWEEGR